MERSRMELSRTDHARTDHARTEHTRTERSAPELDREVPVLLVKVGRYPQTPSHLGAVRSFGRLGVPVYAMVEDRLTPTAVSRYLTGAFVRPSTGREPAGELLAAILAAGRAIGRRSVAVATDDESAVLLAEHREELARWFLLPPVPAELPRRLASKAGLYAVCREAGIPTPGACAPGSRAELVEAGRRWGYPLVLKNLEPFTRLRRPVVGHTTVVRSEEELLAVLAGGGPADGAPSVLAQEYLPPERSEDWITHLCCGPGGEPLALFTGRKVRSWPPGRGVTARARACPNPELAALAARLCRRIGYRGVADLDWRLDRRDGRYKLVDFNPRTGAQFRLFETVDGVDVVRALHLALTGRPVPCGPQLSRSFGVGQIDLLSVVATSWGERRAPRDVWPRRSTERAWLCRDDLAPTVAEAARFGCSAVRVLAGGVRGRG